MKIDFTKSFVKDLKKNKTNKSLMKQVQTIIHEVENSHNIHGIRNIKKLKSYKKYYRIRTGDYRLGLIIENDVIHFVRLLHRSSIYHNFPTI